jgi:SAM-dependent methyltransferase
MASIFHRAIAVARTRASIARQRRLLRPKLGAVDFGDLRSTSPVSAVFGLDRGQPIDRYYIERFLGEHRDVIAGRVLEVADATYTKRFGGKAVTRSDVLHLTGESSETTIVADLADAKGIADDTFDCVILTQTLQFIFPIGAAVSEVRRILKPGGTALCTATGISRISRYDMDRWGDFWRLTSCSARRLFGDAFGEGAVEVTTYGNVLAATAFLEGLAAEELTTAELDAHDDDYQLLIAVRATKPLV